MDTGRLVRLFRARRRLSQREFAALAGIPRTTVDRIESGRCEPKLSTLCRLAEVAGCRVVVVAGKDRLVLPEEGFDKPRDRGGRNFPAHLKVFKTPEYTSIHYRDWWGWDRIAWPFDDSRKPEYTYLRRWRLAWEEMWHDAT